MPSVSQTTEFVTVTVLALLPSFVSAAKLIYFDVLKELICRLINLIRLGRQRQTVRGSPLFKGAHTCTHTDTSRLFAHTTYENVNWLECVAHTLAHCITSFPHRIVVINTCSTAKGSGKVTSVS